MTRPVGDRDVPASYWQLHMWRRDGWVKRLWMKWRKLNENHSKERHDLQGPF